MTVQVTITPNGRMSLPAEIRKRLGLAGGGAVVKGQRDQGFADIHPRHQRRKELIVARPRQVPQAQWHRDQDKGKQDDLHRANLIPTPAGVQSHRVTTARECPGVGAGRQLRAAPLRHLPSDRRDAI